MRWFGLSLMMVVIAMASVPAAEKPVPVVARATPVVNLAWQHHSSGLITTGRYNGLGQWMFTIRAGIDLVACELNQLTRMPNYANSLAVGGKPEMIVVGTNVGTVVLYDSNALAVAKTWKVGPEYSVYAVAIDAEGKHIAACRTDGTVLVWNTRQETPLFHLQKTSREGERMAALAFSPDGKSLATLSRYGYLAMWNLADGSRLGEPVDRVGGEQDTLQFTPDGTRLMLINRASIRSWHPQQEPKPREIVPPEEVCPRYSQAELDRPGSRPDFGHGIRFAGPAALSPNARQVASVLETGGIAIWDLATFKVVTRLPPPVLKVNYDQLGSAFERIAFSPDGNKIAASTTTGELVVWQREARP